MDKGDKVQAKKGFRLLSAVVDLVIGDRVQVYHDMWIKKWLSVESKQRAQSPICNEKPVRTRCRAVDIFDIEKLVVIDG